MSRKSRERRLAEHRERLRAQHREVLLGLYSGKGREEASHPHDVLVARPDALPTQLTVLAYGPDAHDERRLESVDQLEPLVARWPVVWLNVEGLADAEAFARLGQRFGLHRLALEDALTPSQRPKAEAYPGHAFVVARMLTLEESLASEQLSLFVGPGFVLTFQERPGPDPFEPIRKRIRERHGRICTAGADFLAHALLDCVIDAYFPLLEGYAERIAELELRVLSRPDRSVMTDLHAIRRDLMGLRRAVWPLRDALGLLMRDDDQVFQAETRLSLRDCQDHTMQVIDLVESYRELTAALAEMYLESVNHRMNEVMKVLTIIATLFMPLSFLASLYGMNFSPEASPFNMPELHWRYGYPFALSLMAAVALAMLVLFKQKGWLRRDEGPPA